VIFTNVCTNGSPSTIILYILTIEYIKNIKENDGSYQSKRHSKSRVVVVVEEAGKIVFVPYFLIGVVVTVLLIEVRRSRSIEPDDSRRREKESSLGD
jgi:hypothetical protein